MVMAVVVVAAVVSVILCDESVCDVVIPTLHG